MPWLLFGAALRRVLSSKAGSYGMVFLSCLSELVYVYSELKTQPDVIKRPRTPLLSVGSQVLDASKSPGVAGRWVMSLSFIYAHSGICPPWKALHLSRGRAPAARQLCFALRWRISFSPPPCSPFDVRTGMPSPRASVALALCAAFFRQEGRLVKCAAARRVGECEMGRRRVEEFV